MLPRPSRFAFTRISHVMVEENSDLAFADFSSSGSQVAATDTDPIPDPYPAAEVFGGISDESLDSLIDSWHAGRDSNPLAAYRPLPLRFEDRARLLICVGF